MKKSLLYWLFFIIVICIILLCSWKSIYKEGFTNTRYGNTCSALLDPNNLQGGVLGTFNLINTNAFNPKLFEGSGNAMYITLPDKNIFIFSGVSKENCNMYTFLNDLKTRYTKIKLIGGNTNFVSLTWFYASGEVLKFVSIPPRLSTTDINKITDETSYPYYSTIIPDDTNFQINYTIEYDISIRKTQNNASNYLFTVEFTNILIRPSDIVVKWFVNNAQLTDKSELSITYSFPNTGGEFTVMAKILQGNILLKEASTTLTVVNTSSNTSNTSNNNGIPRSQIPPGQEDLYILKSSIVPPVCPACPTVECGTCSTEKKCPPCPPCARCPEPAFECKKVPSYSSLGGSGKLPMPFMSDFSKFG